MTGPEQTEAWAAAEARRVAALRMELVEAHPFWGHVLLQLRLVAAEDLPAFGATDGVRHVWYNPRWTRHLSARQLGFVLAHEIGHVVFESCARRGGRDVRLWNEATDYAINRLVANIPRAEGAGALYAAPDGTYPDVGEVRVLLDRRFDGMGAEAIYARLLAEAAAVRPASDEGPVTMVLPGASGAATVRLGGVLDHRGGVDVHGADVPSGADRAAVAAVVARAFDAARRAERPGDVPGEVARRLAGSHRARVPWGRVVRGYLGGRGPRDDYAARWPDRRYWDEGVVVPGLVASARAGRVVVALDTSGSVSAALLEALAAELGALAAEVEELTLLAGDTTVRQVLCGEAVATWLRAATLPGGGGTDHRPFFAWVAARRERPDLFVGLTDLRSRFPARRPPYPVLWVAPADHAPAPWGRVVAL